MCFDIADSCESHKAHKSFIKMLMNCFAHPSSSALEGKAWRRLCVNIYTSGLKANCLQYRVARIQDFCLN